MQLPLASVLGLTALATQASAHGLVTKPDARTPGAATAEVCGEVMVDFYQADNTSYPEALFRANPDGLDDGYDPAACDLFLCRGYQFGDNKDHVQEYETGQVVDMEVFIRIPHEGYANVSIVDTTTNEVIGEPLVAWADGYAATNNPPEDQTNFSFTIPELDGKCAEAGVCVIQWYWWGQGQTYESCVDFTVAAGGEEEAGGEDGGACEEGGEEEEEEDEEEEEVAIRGRSWY